MSTIENALVFNCRNNSVIRYWSLEQRTQTTLETIPKGVGVRFVVANFLQKNCL